MPLLFHVDKLKPEAHLGADVLKGYEVLLPKGWQLTDKDIDYLKTDFPENYVSLKIPKLDQLLEFESYGQDRDISLRVKKNIFEAFSRLYAYVLMGQEIDDDFILDTKNILAKSLSLVQFNPITTALISSLSVKNDYLAHLTANSFYLSLLIGKKLKNYIKEERRRSSALQGAVQNADSLTPLAVAAFYRDAGLASDAPFWLKDHLDIDDKLDILGHPNKSGEIMAGKISPLARQTILRHHENFDGSGYPERISGDTINIYARILRVADAYCTGLTLDKNRKGKSAVEVLYNIAEGAENNHFDPVVVEALMAVVQPLEIGSQLKLHNGKTAIVVGHNPGVPFRPNIVIAFDAAGNMLRDDSLKKTISMVERTDLKIAAVGNEDTSFLNTGMNNFAMTS